MDYFNRFKSTVSSVAVQVSQNVSQALPGNPILREYTIEKLLASAGPGLCWKIYSGSKNSTKQVLIKQIINWIVSIYLRKSQFGFSRRNTLKVGQSMKKKLSQRHSSGGWFNWPVWGIREYSLLKKHWRNLGIIFHLLLYIFLTYRK